FIALWTEALIPSCRQRNSLRLTRRKKDQGSGPGDAAFGSKADINGMFALRPKADMWRDQYVQGQLPDSRTELLQRRNYRLLFTHLALKVQQLLDRTSVEVFDSGQPHWNVALRASRMRNLFCQNIFLMAV